MDSFWGHSSTFWTAVQTVATCVYTAFIVPTLVLIYFQARTAARSFQLQAICRLQDLVDDFRDDRGSLYTECSLEIALTDGQFPEVPTGRHGKPSKDPSPLLRRLTPEQDAALHAVNAETKRRAQKVIARLNDIGQLVEDGFVQRQVFLGKYHVMVIQCCHMIEAIRREEEARRGGNYGRRLLRMRKWATNYNDAWPKHREVPIEVSGTLDGPLRRVVYSSPPWTPKRGLLWALRRSIGWY